MQLKNYFLDLSNLMQFSNIYLESISAYLPPQVISSQDIEDALSSVYERLNLSPGRLELFTGIKERRAWHPDLKPSDVSTKAAKIAMEEKGLEPQDIDCIIHSSVCRDFLEPATASIIHSNLNLKHHALNFDISNACLGMITGVDLLANLIHSGKIKRGIVVSGEIGLPLTKGTINKLNNASDVTRKSIKQDFASLTIGSAASAIIVSSESVLRGGGHQYLGQSYYASTQYNHLCQGNIEQTTEGEMTFEMQTDSESLMHKGIETAQSCWNLFQRDFWENEIIDKTISHQVGISHRNHLYNKLGIDLNKDFTTFDYFGNCGSSSLPLTLALAQEKKHMKKNDKVALLAIGSGINCSICAINW